MKALVALFSLVAMATSTPVDLEIERVNSESVRHGYPLAKLTRAHFNHALLDGRKFFFPKTLRRDLDLAVTKGYFGSNASLLIQAIPDLDIYRIYYIVAVGPYFTPNIYLVQGNELFLENPETRAGCAKSPELCTEPLFFDNRRAPVSREPAFPYTIKTKILRFTEDQIRERPEVKEFSQQGLDIEVLVTAETIPSLLEYFGFGQNPVELSSRLRSLLGQGTAEAVNLRELMPNAVRVSLNRFPTNSKGEFDVCYNAASTFYAQDHTRGDNSNELLEALIQRYYCPREKLSELRFGDILYSGGHAVRYVMFDVKAGRHVVYQMNSGGFEAWRFLYLEEAFRYQGDHEVPFHDFYDAHYRCR